jgi:hypothetical protein
MILIGGLALFTLGLLVIVRQNPVFGLFSQVTSDSQEILVIGVLVQFLGQAFVIFGAMHSASHKLASSMQVERQITIAAVAQNLQQFQNRYQNEQQALKTGYAQTIAKLDTLMANPKSALTQPKVTLPLNCKFCGAGLEESQFCTKCGKAN